MSIRTFICNVVLKLNCTKTQNSRITNQNYLVCSQEDLSSREAVQATIESREMQKIDEGCECNPEKGESCKMCFTGELSSDSHESAACCFEASSSSQGTGEMTRPRLSRCIIKCLLCSSMFGSKSELIAHKSARFCPTCGSHFRCHDQLIRHTRRHQPDMIQCKACRFQCASIEEMQAHTKALTKCVDCRRFFTCASLRDHLCEEDDGDDAADGATGQPQGLRCMTCYFLMDMKMPNCPRCLSLQQR